MASEEDLKKLIEDKLKGYKFVAVSNREPYIHKVSGDKIKFFQPASGVVTALDPVLQACHGLWVAHGSGDADRKVVDDKSRIQVPPNDPQYTLKRVWLTKAEETGYYYGFANEALWPLCHIVYTKPKFSESDWNYYKLVNERFAKAILEEIGDQETLLFIQDYHFMLLPKLIKDANPKAKIALFWHIPWPNPEVFSICPYQEEIIDGMLGCDILGFHVQYHCNNFLDTVNRLIEARVDTEKFSVVRSNKETLVRAFPISVSNSPGEDTSARRAEIIREFGLEDKIIAVSVERIDYTKGIAERIHAIDRFFEKYPDYKGKIVFVQLAAPSRTHIKRYHDLMAEIDEIVEKVNWKYSDGAWKPILYLKKHFSLEEIKPYYELADICIVSSLHDGMNLVAKEYIVSKKYSQGALILSRFTGAARELIDALLVNPYSTEEFAVAIRDAIEMPEEEKKRRMETMYKTVSENNVYRWAGAIVNELTSIKKNSL